MTQLFGKQAFDLLQEVTQCPAQNLPSFNDDAFRNVLDEIALLHERLSAVFNESRERDRQRRQEQGIDPDSEDNLNTWRGTEAEAAELMVAGTAVESSHSPAHARASLSPLESQFFKGYDKLLSKYMRSGKAGVGLDLTADPTPPDDPYVQVRVLKDYGDVVFASGKVSLARGKSHWLPRDEAHPLIMDGILENVYEASS